MRHLAWNMAVLLGWTGLHVPTLLWLAHRWTASEGHLHLALAVLGLVGLASSVDPARLLDRLASPMRHSTSAWLWAAVPPLIAALVRIWLPLDVVDAIAMVASGYGLLGLLTSAQRWRELRGAAGIAAAVLPLTGYLDVFVGYPLRAATAGLVAGLLGADVTSSTVLAVDGAFAHVDLPCSGVQSLWSGLVVLLGASVVWRRPVDARFLGIAAVVGGLLVGANTARVFALVLLAHVLGWSLVMEVLHVPMGVIGFCLAVGAGLAVLRWTPEPIEHRPRPSRSSRWAPASLLVVLCLTAVIPEPTRAVAPPPAWTLPLPADVSVLPVDPAESAFAAEHGAQVWKGAIDREGVRGTVVVVASRSWLAHHVPTWCLQSAGWTLTGEHPVHIDGAAVRLAQAARLSESAHALWWFESAEQRTDDHTHRVLQGLVNDEPWALVSVLIDGRTDPTDPDVARLVHDLRGAVGAIWSTP